MHQNISRYFNMLICIAGLSLLAAGCSEDQQQNNDTKIVVTITIKEEIFVNGEQVPIDSLAFKFRDLGATKNTFIRIAPDPEAGPGMIDKVQRAIRQYKDSFRNSD